MKPLSLSHHPELMKLLFAVCLTNLWIYYWFVHQLCHQFRTSPPKMVCNKRVDYRSLGLSVVPPRLYFYYYYSIPLVSWLLSTVAADDGDDAVSGWMSRSMICFNLSVVSLTCWVTSVFAVIASSWAWHRSFNDMGRLSISSFMVSAMKITEWLFLRKELAASGTMMVREVGHELLEGRVRFDSAEHQLHTGVDDLHWVGTATRC